MSTCTTTYSTTDSTTVVPDTNSKTAFTCDSVRQIIF